MGGSGGLVRERMLTAKRMAVVFSSLSAVTLRGFLAMVICRHMNALRASFVEYDAALILSFARDMGEK